MLSGSSVPPAPSPKKSATRGDGGVCVSTFCFSSQ